MKKSIIILLVIVSAILSACTTQEKVTNFDECVAAGNPVMESYPEQCAHNGEVFVNDISEPAELEQKPCTREYRPVCGEVDEIQTTFSNSCEAENAGATIIYDGACVDETPNLEGACLSFDGNWLEESQECEGMGQNQCESLGGTFNECASSCRNDPEAVVCTLQCVQVCQFN